MTSAVNSSIQWHAAKDSDKLQYMIKSEELASKIILPVDALMCKNPHCTDHCDDIIVFMNLLFLYLNYLLVTLYPLQLLLRDIILYQGGMNM